jgi:ribosomal protein S18 acetylase RimI-like enzyme
LVHVTVVVRDYEPADEESWLRCRLLSFLHTAYFDDVWTAKPPCPAPGVELVAANGATVVGVIDVQIAGEVALIDTVAVDPDHQRLGIGTALFNAGREQAAAAGALTIEAWTRDDEATLHWYRSHGFVESDQYLHVYANYYVDAGEPDRAVAGRRPGLRPMMLFLHAPLERENELRKDFTRIHICRRFSRPI